jgi:membrane protein
MRREFVMISPTLNWPISYLFCLAVIGTIYRFGPNEGKTRRLWISWGSVMASTFWVAATILFAWYAQNYGTYDRVYGSLGAIVGFLTWIWLLLVILLSGAELNCEVDRRRSQPPTIPAKLRRGRLSAVAKERGIEIFK